MLSLKEDLKEKRMNYDKNYMILFLLLLGLIAVFRLVEIYGERYYTIFETQPFLYYHVLLEFFSIIIYFAIFVITYYTYYKNRRARLIVLFSTFLVVGFIDFFHTMTYKGMPGFFADSSAAIATTYWMIGRIIFSIGLLVAAIIPVHKKINHYRLCYIAGSLLITYAIFYFVTYHIDIFPPMFIEGQGLTPLKVILEYLIMVILSITSFLFIRDYNYTKNIIFIEIVAGLLFAIFSEISFTLYTNVHDSFNMIGHIYKVISSYLIFKALFIYNLDAPYIQLSYATEEIKKYAENLEELVTERTKELEEANKKIVRDLQYARRIQQSLLPSKIMKIKNVSFVSEFIPCQNVSGDFYDIYEIDEENIGIYIADVAGHGPSAAMMTIFTERAVSHKNTIISKHDALNCEKNLFHIYKEFNKSNLPAEMHIAILNGIYNTTTGVFSYCSAGLNTVPILLSASGRLELLDQSQGFPICKLGDLFVPEYKKAEVQLNKGDRIIFYTDGLVGNFKYNTFMENDTLEKLLYQNKNANGKTLRKEINRKIRETAKHKAIEDDITFLIMDIIS